MKILIPLLFLVIACHSPVLNNISAIKMYAISPYSSSPIPVRDDWVRYEEPIWINNKDDINFILAKTRSLKKQMTTKFDESNLRMRCILYDEKKDSTVLEYNNYAIRVDGTVYERDSTLIEFLYSKALK